MFLKASYAVLSLSSIVVMLFAAPRGALFTSAPERGKVERRVDPATGNATVRRPTFVFIGGGYHGGK